VEKAAAYSAGHADVTLRLHQTLWPKLETFPQLKRLYEELEQPLVPVLQRMEHRGVLLDSDLLRDPRNLVTVHFYYPFLFTHQTATWTMPYLSGVVGVPYPAAEGSLVMTLSSTREQFRKIALPANVSPVLTQLKAEREVLKYFYEGQGPAQVEGWMRQVAEWQQRQRVDSDRIVFTEFGAMKQKVQGVVIDKGSRARWLHDASAEIERHGWGWTVFVLRDDPFGIYDRMSDRYPDPALLRALRLNVPAEGE